MDDAKAFMLGLMQTARERFGNPLIGAFAIAWALWNFRIILILVGSGDGGWKAKIEHIDTKLMPHWYDWAIHCYLVPAVFAIVWIYVLPPILRKVAAHHEKNISRNREAIFSVTETRLLSTEEAMHMRQVILKQRAEWLAEKYTHSQALETYAKQFKESSQEIEEKIKKISELKRENEDLLNQISDLKIKKLEPFEFKGKTTQDKANALDIEFPPKDKQFQTAALVTFDGHRIQWPWVISEKNKINLPYEKMLDFPIDQQTFNAMLFINNNYSNESEPHSINWKNRLFMAGFDNPEEILRKLIISGYFLEEKEKLIIIPEANSQINWLENIGFSQEPDPRR